MKRLFNALLFSFCTTLALGQSVLEYDLKDGDIFTVKQNAEQVITQEMDGAAHVLTNTIDGILEFKVMGDEDDNYLISLTFKDLNMLMNSSIQGELMKVHAKEVVEGDMQSQIFNSLLNNPVELTLAKTGDILQVSGGDSLITKMANASGVEDDFTKNMMKKSLEKEFGSEALSNNYKQMTYIYSDDEVNLGDSWQNAYAGKLNAQNTWTLQAIEDTEITISGNADVSIRTEEQSITMDLKGTQRTAISADRNSGFINFMKVEGEFKGASLMPQMGETEIPTTIHSVTTYELIK